MKKIKLKNILILFKKLYMRLFSWMNKDPLKKKERKKRADKSKNLTLQFF